MGAIGIVLNFFLLGMLLYIVFTFRKEYKEAQGTIWGRLKEASQDSLKVLWAKIITIATLLINSIAFVGMLIDPELEARIKSNLNPEWVGAAGLIMIGLLLVAKMRNSN